MYPFEKRERKEESGEVRGGGEGDKENRGGTISQCREYACFKCSDLACIIT